MSGSNSGSDGGGSGKNAWVTLATNDSYSLGALVVAFSLRRVETVHQLAVLVTPGVSESMRVKMRTIFDLVQEVDVLDSRDTANLALLARPELGITFTKLHCWRLTQYAKCVFLDADTLVLQNCDELFERAELSAAPDVGWPDCFNSGVFVYQPNQATYENLLTFAVKQGSFDGGDQGLLNSFFSDWAHRDINKHLPFIYNTCSTATYSYMPAFKQFGENVKILHFIGATKPWLLNFDSRTKTVQTPAGYQHLGNYLQRWWNIFCDDVHGRLSSEMNLAKLQGDGTAPWYDNPKFQYVPPECVHKVMPKIIDPWEDYEHKVERIVDVELAKRYNQIDGHTGVDDRCTHSSDQKSEIAESWPTAQLSTSGHQLVDNNAIMVRSFYSDDVSENYEMNSATVAAATATPTATNVGVPAAASDSVDSSGYDASDDESIYEDTNDYIQCNGYSDNSSESARSPRPLSPTPPHYIEESGIAGALSKLRLGEERSREQSDYEESMRKQCWEAGNIDYMGRDSFANIWERISQTIDTKSPSPSKGDGDGLSSASASASHERMATPQPEELSPIDAKKEVQIVATIDERDELSAEPETLQSRGNIEPTMSVTSPIVVSTLDSVSVDTAAVNAAIPNTIPAPSQTQQTLHTLNTQIKQASVDELEPKAVPTDEVSPPEAATAEAKKLTKKSGTLKSLKLKKSEDSVSSTSSTASTPTEESAGALADAPKKVKKFKKPGLLGGSPMSDPAPVTKKLRKTAKTKATEQAPPERVGETRVVIEKTADGKTIEKRITVYPGVETEEIEEFEEEEIIEGDKSTVTIIKDTRKQAGTSAASPTTEEVRTFSEVRPDGALVERTVTIYPGSETVEEFEEQSVTEGDDTVVTVIKDTRKKKPGLYGGNPADGGASAPTKTKKAAAKPVQETQVATVPHSSTIEDRVDFDPTTNTTTVTKRTATGYEQVLTTVMPDGTKKTQTKTFFDPEEEEITEEYEEEVIEPGETVTTTTTTAVEQASKTVKSSGVTSTTTVADGGNETCQTTEQTVATRTQQMEKRGSITVTTEQTKNIQQQLQLTETAATTAENTKKRVTKSSKDSDKSTVIVEKTDEEQQRGVGVETTVIEVLPDGRKVERTYTTYPRTETITTDETDEVSVTVDGKTVVTTKNKQTCEELEKRKKQTATTPNDPKDIVPKIMPNDEVSHPSDGVTVIQRLLEDQSTLIITITVTADGKTSVHRRTIGVEEETEEVEEYEETLEEPATTTTTTTTTTDTKLNATNEQTNNKTEQSNTPAKQVAPKPNVGTKTTGNTQEETTIVTSEQTVITEKTQKQQQQQQVQVKQDTSDAPHTAPKPIPDGGVEKVILEVLPGGKTIQRTIVVYPGQENVTTDETTTTQVTDETTITSTQNTKTPKTPSAQPSDNKSIPNKTAEDIVPPILPGDEVTHPSEGVTIIKRIQEDKTVLYITITKTSDGKTTVQRTTGAEPGKDIVPPILPGDEVTHPSEGVTIIKRIQEDKTVLYITITKTSDGKTTVQRTTGAEPGKDIVPPILPGDEVTHPSEGVTIIKRIQEDTSVLTITITKTTDGKTTVQQSTSRKEPSKDIVPATLPGDEVTHPSEGVTIIRRVLKDQSILVITITKTSDGKVTVEEQTTSVPEEIEITEECSITYSKPSKETTTATNTTTTTKEIEQTRTITDQQQKAPPPKDTKTPAGTVPKPQLVKKKIVNEQGEEIEVVEEITEAEDVTVIQSTTDSTTNKTLKNPPQDDGDKSSVIATHTTETGGTETTQTLVEQNQYAIQQQVTRQQHVIQRQVQITLQTEHMIEQFSDEDCKRLQQQVSLELEDTLSKQRLVQQEQINKVLEQIVQQQISQFQKQLTQEHTQMNTTQQSSVVTSHTHETDTKNHVQSQQSLTNPSEPSSLALDTQTNRQVGSVIVESTTTGAGGEVTTVTSKRLANGIEYTYTTAYPDGTRKMESKTFFDTVQLADGGEQTHEEETTVIDAHGNEMSTVKLMSHTKTAETKSSTSKIASTATGTGTATATPKVTIPGSGMIIGTPTVTSATPPALTHHTQSISTDPTALNVDSSIPETPPATAKGFPQKKQQPGQTVVTALASNLASLKTGTTALQTVATKEQKTTMTTTTTATATVTPVPPPRKKETKKSTVNSSLTSSSSSSLSNAKK